jgi:S-DNA-T family DNA segregation ATPase FtsK/SpoIIIE
LRKEIRGIVFLLLVIVLGVSLLSYHPADPVLGIKTDHAKNLHNLFGPVGAHLAGWIFLVLGFSSLWLVAVFAALSILSFRDLALPSPAKSVTATLCLLLSFSGLLNLYLPQKIAYRGGTVISGGLIGNHIARFMTNLLNDFGACVILGAVFIISFMVLTDASFGWLFSNIYLWGNSLVRRIRDVSVKKTEQKRKRRIREEYVEREKTKPKRQVTIVEPKPEPIKKPEQEAFPFMNVVGDFKLPPVDLLTKAPTDKPVEIQKESLEMNARRLEGKLADFDVEGEVVEILPGPVITMYELKPAPGVKISKVAGLSDDLALALRAPSVRIVAPIPGKAAIGIEIPNNQRSIVYLEEILSAPEFRNSQHKLTMALGKDITGAPFVTVLA